jgi:CHASE2 domain-containing sensor protein
MAALNHAQKAVDSGQVAAQTLTQPWTQELVRFLAMSVLGFSCAAMLLATALLWRSSASPQYILKIFGLITILGFSALLLVVGYNNEQLTPIIGLFGAIAGYLLGKDTKAHPDDKG